MTCTDFDPEEGYDLSNARQRAASDEEDSASEDEATGREHYVDVGPSELRRRAAVSEHASLADPKYSGVKATRADLYGDEAESEEGLDDEEMGSEIDEEAASGDDQESGAEEEGDGSEDEVEEEENGSAGDEGEEEDGEVASEDDAEGPSGSAAPPAKTNKKTARFASSATAGSSDDPNSLAAQAEEEARMMRELRARGNADAEKGRAVRKQMSTWDALLDARIRIQKLVQRTARLPPVSIWRADLSCSESMKQVDSKSFLRGKDEQMKILAH